MDSITFIGHSSLKVTLDGKTFLVDPIFSPRILNFVNRHKTAGVDPGSLSDISAFLITSAQYDHLDIFSYKYFKQNIPLVAPVGVENFYHRFLHNPVIELKPWTEQDFDSVKIVALPSKYFCWRFFGFSAVTGNGYILQGSRHTVFISGDSGYGRHFAEIGNAFAIDVACLPIGGYHPRWLMGGRHMNPAQSLKAFGDLGAKAMVPIHFGTFQLSFEPLDEPERKLREEIHLHRLELSAKILTPGESFSLDELALLSAPGIPSPMATIHTLKTPA